MDSWYFVSRLVDPFLVQGFWKKGVDFFGRKGRCRFFNGCMELRGQGRWDQEGIEAVQNDPQKIGSKIRVVDHLAAKTPNVQGLEPTHRKCNKISIPISLRSVYVFLKSIQRCIRKWKLTIIIFTKKIDSFINHFLDGSFLQKSTSITTQAQKNASKNQFRFTEKIPCREFFPRELSPGLAEGEAKRATGPAWGAPLAAVGMVMLDSLVLFGFGSSYPSLKLALTHENKAGSQKGSRFSLGIHFWGRFVSFREFDICPDEMTLWISFRIRGSFMDVQLELGRVGIRNLGGSNSANVDVFPTFSSDFANNLIILSFLNMAHPHFPKSRLWSWSKVARNLEAWLFQEYSGAPAGMKIISNEIVKSSQNGQPLSIIFWMLVK